MERPDLDLIEKSASDGVGFSAAGSRCITILDLVAYIRHLESGAPALRKVLEVLECRCYAAAINILRDEISKEAPHAT